MRPQLIMSKYAIDVNINERKMKWTLYFVFNVLNGCTVCGGRVEVEGDHVGSSGWVDRGQ